MLLRTLVIVFWAITLSSCVRSPKCETDCSISSLLFFLPSLTPNVLHISASDFSNSVMGSVTFDSTLTMNSIGQTTPVVGVPGQPVIASHDRLLYWHAGNATSGNIRAFTLNGQTTPIEITNLSGELDSAKTILADDGRTLYLAHSGSLPTIEVVKLNASNVLEHLQTLSISASNSLSDIILSPDEKWLVGIAQTSQEVLIFEITNSGRIIHRSTTKTTLDFPSKATFADPLSFTFFVFNQNSVVDSTPDIEPYILDSSTGSITQLPSVNIPFLNPSSVTRVGITNQYFLSDTTTDFYLIELDGETGTAELIRHYPLGNTTVSHVIADSSMSLVAISDIGAGIVELGTFDLDTKNISKGPGYNIPSFVPLLSNFQHARTY